MNEKSRRRIHWLFFSLLACFAVSTCRAQYVIDSLDGEVTQHEVDTFISNVTALPIPTIEDPGTFVKPWNLDMTWELAPGEEILEYVCAENNQYRDPAVGK